MSESALERKVVAYCKSRGMLCYKFSSPARRGVPDRLILYKGRAMFLELKAPGKELNALQLRELALLAKEGFVAVWTDTFVVAKAHIDGLHQRASYDLGVP